MAFDFFFLGFAFFFTFSGLASAFVEVFLPDFLLYEAPEFSRIQKVKDFVKLLGLPFPDQPTQADYQKVIEATKDR
ncbi:hypothetical protein B4Q05_15105, partial [Acinetobacter baumannii]